MTPDEVSDEKIANYRSYVRDSVMMHGLSHMGISVPFQGLSWDYFLADVELEARAARIKLPDRTVGSICDTIEALPPASIVRLMAARIVYFSALAPENEAQVDWLLQGQDASTVSRMRQRRHAVHAIQATESKQEATRNKTPTQEENLESQYWPCPHAQLSSEPEDFLGWIRVQTPDTWHVIVEGWDYNSADRDDVIEWIFEQPNCDLGTAAQFFFTAAIGLAGEDPEKLSPGYRRKWQLMKRVADNWQFGLYSRRELQHSVQPSDEGYYDDLVARREAAGRPLPWKVPGPKARRFGGRLADSAYCYEDTHLRLRFAAWKQQRERFGCGKDFPRCCSA
jgi:hypothetical protein